MSVSFSEMIRTACLASRQQISRR